MSNGSEDEWEKKIEANRQAIAPSALTVLESKRMRPDDVLPMARLEFEALIERLVKAGVSVRDRRTLITFKMESMTPGQERIFYKRTRAEDEKDQ